MPLSGGSPEPSFDLHLEGVAGNSLGGTGDTLTISAFDLTAGTPAPGLTPPGGPTFSQSFTGAFWVPSGYGTPPPEYVTNQPFITGSPLPAGVCQVMYSSTPPHWSARAPCRFGSS